MDEDLKVEWLKFLQGRWVREMPKQAGSYPIATREGAAAGYCVVYFDCNTETWKDAKDFGEGGWAGFWWSLPVPDLPEPPMWDNGIKGIRRNRIY